MRLRGGSDIDSGALILVGDADSFTRLAHVLRTAEPATIEVDELTGRPAIGPVDMLYLERADGLTTIQVTGRAATLSGSPESCARLADEIDLFLAHNDLSEPGVHVHIEAPPPSTGHGVLASHSRGLILAGPIPDD